MGRLQIKGEQNYFKCMTLYLVLYWDGVGGREGGGKKDITGWTDKTGLQTVKYQC